MCPKPVLKKDLVNDLKELRESFLKWDNQRRLKVDIILKSLDQQQTVNLERSLTNIDLLAQKDYRYHELAPAAKKMLKIHYLELARSDDKIESDHQRRERARLKLEHFKNKGML